MREEGVFKARAVSWGLTTTANDNEQFWMCFDLIGKADKADMEAPLQTCEPGTAVWSITLSSEENVEWLVSTVQHLGYDGVDLLALDPDMPGACNFEGVEFFALCRHEAHQGRSREQWSVYKPKAKLTKDRLKALNARYGHKVMELKDRRTVKASAAANGDKGTTP
jgi:hypothetical protein